MNINIKITGGGTDEEVAHALEIIALEIREGYHHERINERGECEWEDEILMTEITEEEGKD